MLVNFCYCYVDLLVDCSLVARVVYKCLKASICWYINNWDEVSTALHQLPNVLLPYRIQHFYVLHSRYHHMPVQKYIILYIMIIKNLLEYIFKLTLIRPGITFDKWGSIASRPQCSTTLWSIFIAPIFKGYGSVVIIVDTKWITCSGFKTIAIVAAHFSAIHKT